MYIGGKVKILLKYSFQKILFEGLVKLTLTNSIISIKPWEFTCQFLLCSQLLFLIPLTFFSRGTIFENNSIEVTAKHET